MRPTFDSNRLRFRLLDYWARALRHLMKAERGWFASACSLGGEPTVRQRNLSVSRRLPTYRHSAVTSAR
jgi:hypothetical protein